MDLDSLWFGYADFTDSHWPNHSNFELNFEDNFIINFSLSLPSLSLAHSLVVMNVDLVRGCGRVLPTASDAHFARIEREAEDTRHARMLHTIANRPNTQAVGHFKNANKHEFYARTLAVRKKNARIYKEFARQKENLLLLQRLQQIHFYEHPSYSKSRIGKNYSNDWSRHQLLYDQAKARLSKRPRVGSSLIFAKTVKRSPLEERNRRESEGERYKKGIWRDTTGMRDEEILAELEQKKRDKKNRLKRDDSQHSSAASSVDPSERFALEAELGRRWSKYSTEHNSGAPISWTDFELGEDIEDAHLAEWAKNHTRGFLPVDSVPNLNPTSTSTPASDPSTILLQPQQIDAQRRATMRARYIDEEEEDFDCDESSDLTSMNHPLRTSLYDLATNNVAAQGDDFVQQYRLSQYHHSLPSPPMPAPIPPPLPLPFDSRHEFSVGFEALDSPHSHEIDHVLAVLAEFDDLECDDSNQPVRHTAGERRARQLRQSRESFYHTRNNSIQPMSTSSSVDRLVILDGRGARTVTASQANNTRAQSHTRSPSLSYERTRSTSSLSSTNDSDSDAYMRSLANRFPTPIPPSSSHHTDPSHSAPSRPTHRRPMTATSSTHLRSDSSQSSISTAHAPTPLPPSAARPTTGFMRPTFATRQYANVNQAQLKQAKH